MYCSFYFKTKNKSHLSIRFLCNLSISQRSLRQIIIWLTIRCQNCADCGLRSETSRLAKFMHEHKLKWLLVSSNTILRIHEGFIEQICSEVAILLGTFVSKVFSSAKSKTYTTALIKHVSRKLGSLCCMSTFIHRPLLDIVCYVYVNFPY